MTDRPLPSRRLFLQAGAVTGAFAALAGCSTDRPAPAGTASAPATTPSSAAVSSSSAVVDSWAPAPVSAGGLTGVCLQEGEHLVLHTRGGRRTFLPGVGLSAPRPGHGAGTDPTAEDYRRWFPMIAGLGLRVIRLDRIAPPAFYTELLRYDEDHPDSPLYLIQGVSLPEPARAPRAGEALSPRTRTAFTAEIAAASAAVHGDLTGRAASGASGPWTADVSPWLAGWLLHPPASPTTIAATDRAGRVAPFTGRYFTSRPGASPTATWLASTMDALASAEAERGTTAPIAVANTVETDPLRHPEEPMPGNDLVGVDVTRIAATRAWPAGTFAAYRAYPYGPAFLRLQPAYQGDDPYRAYLSALAAHHEGTPVMVTEFGIPASLGRSGVGENERHGGGVSERQARTVEADLLRLFHDVGLAGGLLTSWTDDWSAQAPPTAPRHRGIDPARRALWHDPLTSTQWLGLLAHDPARAGEVVVHEDPDAEMTKVTVDQDASYLYLTFFFTRRVTSPVDVGFDLFAADGNRLPGGTGENDYDVALHLVPTMSTTTAYVRRTLDPVRLDGLSPVFLPRPEMRGWTVESLTVEPPFVTDGQTSPPVMQRVGELVLGTWDPADPGSSSLATWQLVRPDATRPMEWRLRLPWSMLTMADPSAGTAVVPSLGEPTYQPVHGMDVMIESSTPGSPATFHVDLRRWNTPPRTTERLRAGTDVLRDTLAGLTGPA